MTIKYISSNQTYAIYHNNKPYIWNIKTRAKAEQLLAIFSKYAK